MSSRYWSETPNVLNVDKLIVAGTEIDGIDTTMASPSSSLVPTSAAVAGYTLTLEQNLSWKDAVISRYDNHIALPVGPANGDRYIALATEMGWTVNNIFTYNSATDTWIEDVCESGDAVFVLSNATAFIFNGTHWVLLSVFTQPVVAIEGIVNVPDIAIPSLNAYIQTLPSVGGFLANRVYRFSDGHWIDVYSADPPVGLTVLYLPSGGRLTYYASGWSQFLRISDITDSTTSETGGLVVEGGIGCGKSLTSRKLRVTTTGGAVAELVLNCTGSAVGTPVTLIRMQSETIRSKGIQLESLATNLIWFAGTIYNAPRQFYFRLTDGGTVSTPLVLDQGITQPTKLRIGDDPASLCESAKVEGLVWPSVSSQVPLTLTYRAHSYGQRTVLTLPSFVITYSGAGATSLTLNSALTGIMRPSQRIISKIGVTVDGVNRTSFYLIEPDETSIQLVFLSAVADGDVIAVDASCISFNSNELVPARTHVFAEDIQLGSSTYAQDISVHDDVISIGNNLNYLSETQYMKPGTSSVGAALRLARGTLTFNGSGTDNTVETVFIIGAGRLSSQSTFFSTKESTETTNGALAIKGGVGIGGKLNVAGDAVVNSITQGNGRWEDVNVLANSRTNPSAALPFVEYASGFFHYRFTADSEWLYFTYQMPHGARTGTGAKIYPHLHLVTNADPPDTPLSKFEMVYYITNIGDAVVPSTASNTVTAEFDDTMAAHTHLLLNIPSTGIDSSTMTASSILNCRLRRIPATVGPELFRFWWLLSLDVHTEMVSIGKDFTP